MPANPNSKSPVSLAAKWKERNKATDNNTELSLKRKDKFLEKLESSDVPITTRVCAELEIKAKAVYDWRRNDPYFRQQMDVIQKAALESMLDESILSNRKLEKSTSLLLMFRLKALDPKYRDKQEHFHTHQISPKQHEAAKRYEEWEQMPESEKQQFDVRDADTGEILNSTETDEG